MLGYLAPKRASGYGCTIVTGGNRGSRRAATRSLFPYLVENCPNRVLDDFVLQGRDRQRELHINTLSPRAGLRSSILFTRFVAKAFRY
jgi:hypothetical protein